MDSKALILAFSPAQLALMLCAAVLAVIVLWKWAFSQFQDRITEGFEGLKDEIGQIRKEMKHHPTREEVREMIGRRVAEAQLGAHPWRRSTDETLPGIDG